MSILIRVFEQEIYFSENGVISRGVLT